MAQERVLISSDPGKVTAELEDNDATRALARMLPLTIEMRDHLRQEKTGDLPSPLPAVERLLDFSAGTLGLWGSDHIVIYYRKGRVPQPGIVLLGRVTGDVSSLDVRIEDVPDASIQNPTDAVIRVTHACICGSDLWPYNGRANMTGQRMGHEAIGVVEEVGGDVQRLRLGQVVVMLFA